MSCVSPEKYTHNPKDVSFPLCNNLEGKHALNLVYAYTNSTRPNIAEHVVTFPGNMSAKAVCIAKENPIANMIILKSEKVPGLEGLVVNSSTMMVERPLYGYARALDVKDVKGSLRNHLFTASLGRSEWEKNLLAPLDDFLNLFVNLIILNGLQSEMGNQFMSNVTNYSNWAKKQVGFDAYWNHE